MTLLADTPMHDIKSRIIDIEKILRGQDWQPDDADGYSEAIVSLQLLANQVADLGMSHEDQARKRAEAASRAINSDEDLAREVEDWKQNHLKESEDARRKAFDAREAERALAAKAAKDKADKATSPGKIDVGVQSTPKKEHEFASGNRK